MIFDSSVLPSKREIDPVNGFLRVEMSNITKAQVRNYLGREIPSYKEFNLDPNKIYNVLCPKEELEKAAKTFDNLPLTREHIEVDVDDVPKEKIVGSLGDHATVDGKYLKNNLIIYDKKDIDLVMSGKKKELSCGYRYTPVRESGEYEGQHYDFKMTDIVGNHVALVKQGRAGRDVMVADTSKGLLETIKEKIMAVFDNDLVGDEFKESEHPRAENGQFTSKGGSGSSGSVEHKGAKIDIKKDGKYADIKIYAPEGKKFKNGDTFYTTESEADKAEELAKKIIDNEFGDEGSEKKEESKESAVEKMYKKLSEQGMKGEALEQAIYEKHGWEGVEEAKMISEYESGNPKHSLKEQESLVKSLKEDLDEYKKIVSNFEKDGETGLDYQHYKKMVERQEGALKKAESQLDWIKRHTKESSVSPDVAKHLEKKINGWYDNVRQDYEGIDGKFLGVSAEGDKLKIKWEENGKEKTSTISWYKDYTPEQLYDIWMEFGDEGQEAVDSKKMTKDAMSKEDKIGVVMKEFKEGELKSGSGEKVTDPKQAIAIALSEADKVAKDEIPEKAGKPEKAGEENALQQGEKKMAEEVKEEVKTEEKVETTPAEEKPVEDACSKDEEVKKKSEEEVIEDEKEKDDLKGKEKKAFAEGVDYGEKKEKEEPKKLDSEHESEGAKKADEEEKEEKKEMAKDSELVMDADALRAEGREQAMADFKARDCARKSVRSIVGDVDIFAFDSAEDIYKFACKEAGMNLDEIVSFKDAFAGLQAGKAKLALDASPVSGSNEECFKNIRLA